MANNTTPETKEDKLIRILRIGIIILAIFLIILLAIILTYVFFPNKLTLPFKSSNSVDSEITTTADIELIDPEISSTTNQDGSITVAIDNPNTTGDIFYTIDGSEPSINSIRYEAPFSVSPSTTLNTRIIDKNGTMSSVATQQVTNEDEVVETPITTAETTPTSTTYTTDEEIMASISGQWTNGNNCYIYFQSAQEGSHSAMQYTDMRDGMSGTYGITDISGNQLSINIYDQQIGGISLDDTFTIDIGTQGDGIIDIFGKSWTYVSDSPIY